MPFPSARSGVAVTPNPLHEFGNKLTAFPHWFDLLKNMERPSLEKFLLWIVDVDEDEEVEILKKMTTLRTLMSEETWHAVARQLTILSQQPDREMFLDTLVKTFKPAATKPKGEVVKVEKVEEPKEKETAWWDKMIERHRADEERLVRICLARSLEHLLSMRPAETLQWMRFFYRATAGKPAEHQNVRRAVTRALPGLVALLGGPYDEPALHLLRAMAADADVHIRRALCDTQPRIAERSRETALNLIEDHLLQDRDQFVSERTWSTLRRLMGQGVERAEDLCARLIELA